MGDIISVDLKALDKQIRAMLDSDMDEDCKSGLHSLLGEIYDHIRSSGEARLKRYEPSKSRKKSGHYE